MSSVNIRGSAFASKSFSLSVGLRSFNERTLNVTLENPFLLKAKEKRRVAVGPYDKGTKRPRYEALIEAPPHVKHLIERKQFLLEQGDGYVWVWDFENRSDSQLPAIITIIRDGSPIPPINSP